MKPSELLLPYDEFSKLPRSDDAEDRAWRAAWERYDLSVSPMDDRERAQRRLGHYLGWIGARADALEEAARLCEAPRSRSWSPEECATAIRRILHPKTCGPTPVGDLLPKREPAPDGKRWRCWCGEVHDQIALALACVHPKVSREVIGEGTVVRHRAGWTGKVSALRCSLHAGRCPGIMVAPTVLGGTMRRCVLPTDLRVDSGKVWTPPPRPTCECGEPGMVRSERPEWVCVNDECRAYGQQLRPVYPGEVIA